VLFQFVLVSADPSSAHMIGPSWENGVYNPGYNHIGYHPSTGDRFFRWFDETGNPAWIEAQRRFATTYYNYHYFWNRQRGVPLPYLDWRLSGGTAGCGNESYAFDFCLGYPRKAGAIAEARWSQDGSSHVYRAGIVTLDGFTARQKEAIVCHEVTHILGLDHNAHYSTSASQSCMYPSIGANPAVAYDVHDDTTLRQFYSGHRP
jgi:hypothetical protein